jgi:hypothetical protein
MNAMQSHLAAIESGNVTKTNVIGLRKALNHVARLEAGLSGNRCNATADEVRAAVAALKRLEPLVRGELHASGVRLITSPRWRKRFNAAESAVIASLHGFRLVRFDFIDSYQVTPVYRACGESGSFLFRNIPWQTAHYGGHESGPEVVTESGS